MQKIIKKSALTIFIIFLWILIWYGVEKYVDSKLIMAGPKDTLVAFIKIMSSKSFLLIIKNSTLAILQGLFFACISAILLALIAHNISFIKKFLKPAILLMKSIPVASFVILALLFIGSKELSKLIVFLITFPIIYTQLLSGFEQIHSNMNGLALDFKLSLIKRIFFLNIPAIYASFLASLSVCVGMSFKAGIAAEVIGQPINSIGEELYFSKLYLETGDLFAWTLVIIIVSGISEFVIIGILRLIAKLFRLIYENAGKNAYTIDAKKTAQVMNSFMKKKAIVNKIILNDISKKYDDKTILSHVSLEANSNTITSIIGPSGIGKTTLLNIIKGSVKADKESLLIDSSVSFANLYQETRLFDYGNGVFNISLVIDDTFSKNDKHIISINLLKELLDENDIFLPIQKMSGGMKRRVEIARAFASNDNVIILDEPFKGLDAVNKERVATFISKYKKNRIIIAAVHSDEDARILCSDRIISL